MDCQLHHDNGNAVGDASLPQIVMGNAISVGPINSVMHLRLLLRQYLGVDLAP